METLNLFRIVIADDHDIVRKGLKLFFTEIRDVEVVDEASNGDEIMEKLSSNDNIDMLILDIDMPKLNGLSAIKNIKIQFPKLKILIFSMHPEKVYAINTLKFGADGYVSKESNMDNLLVAIDKIRKNDKYISNELAQRMALEEASDKPVKLYKKLSKRESEILKLLCSGKRNKEVSKELQINEKTVSTYKLRIFKKLGVNNIADLINSTKDARINYS